MSTITISNPQLGTFKRRSERPYRWVIVVDRYAKAEVEKLLRRNLARLNEELGRYQEVLSKASSAGLRDWDDVIPASITGSRDAAWKVSDFAEWRTGVLFRIERVEKEAGIALKADGFHALSWSQSPGSAEARFRSAIREGYNQVYLLDACGCILEQHDSKD